LYFIVVFSYPTASVFNTQSVSLHLKTAASVS